MTRVRGLSDGFRREECLATNCIDGYQGDQWIDHEEWDKDTKDTKDTTRIAGLGVEIGWTRGRYRRRAPFPL